MGVVVVVMLIVVLLSKALSMAHVLMGSHNLEFCMGAVPTVFPQVSHENGMKILTILQ